MRVCRRPRPHGNCYDPVMSHSASPSKWSLVPLLAAAGFISGNGSLVFIWTLGIHPAVFVFFASLTLGLVLASVLWYRGILHSWQAAASFVVTTAAVVAGGASTGRRRFGRHSPLRASPRASSMAAR